MNKFSRGFAPILALILVVVVGTDAYFLIKQKEIHIESGPVTEITTSPTIVPTEPIISQIPALDKSNWKTYIGHCGFSLKYPETYSVETLQSCPEGHHQDGSITSPDYGQTLLINIYVDNTPSSTNFDDEIESYLGWTKPNQEVTSLMGNPAIKLKYNENEQAGFDGGVSTGILILKDKKFFQFNVTGDETTISIFDQILSTFKFLD